MADEVFNSSQPYELSVLKKRALPLLETEPGSKFEAEAKRLNVYQIFGWNDSVIDYMKFVLEKRKGVAA